MEPDTLRPLIVDLDGTLVHTDTLHEQALALVEQKFLKVFLLPVWLARGKAHLKQQLAQQVRLEADELPYNSDLLEWLKAEKATGRKLVLCTAAAEKTAKNVAQHLKIFDEVLASSGQMNLSGKCKADRLVQRFGLKGFDYIGNSHDDLPVWQAAHQAIVVNASASVRNMVQQHGNVHKIFPAHTLRVRDLAKMLRVHQWLKNLLLFIPLLGAHQLGNMAGWGATLLAFFSFSLCASAVYISNDLLDLSSDRQHPRKRLRPFASGVAPVALGVAIAPLLAMASVALAMAVGPRFLVWLTVYFVMTCWYSVSLKRLVLLDCITLACLYTLRIVSGAAATGLILSHWLLAVSGFMFLSLSFLKRHTELRHLAQHGEMAAANKRGYVAQDAGLIAMFGIAAGYAATVVLALYLHGETALTLYTLPHAILVTVGVLVYWISWMWLKSHRNEMHDDPVVFAVKDRVSLICGAIFIASLVLATVGLPW